MNPEQPKLKHEVHDLDARGVGLLGGALIVGLIVTAIACVVLYERFSFRTRQAEGPLAEPLPAKVKPFPEPRLQVNPALDLARLRSEEERVLTGYRWIDRGNGVVGIPIERAMELLVERGVPVGPGEQGQPGPTWEEMLQRRAEQGTSGGNAERAMP